MRLIHTADWQIGKVFRFVDRGTMGVLQEARLEAISAIGRLATAHAAPIVLVAGDIYDIATAESRTLAQPLARMHAFAGVEWHLIPGNHDPHQPGGPWERLLQRGLPANVRVHLEATPVALTEGAALLPAPLARRRALADPTGWMDQAATPEGTIRIGLAHGSISAFGSDADTQPNLIDPGRPEQAGLAYLALGDWHGTKRIGPRCWYAGTPEIDDFEVDGGGHALLVDLAAPGAPPMVRPLATGRFEWRRETVQIHGDDDEIDVVTARLRALHEDPACLLIDLRLEGTLSLSGREHLARALDDFGAALRFLRFDDGGLYLSPSAEDLEAIAPGGFVRRAAETLRAMADDSEAPARDLAARALLRLYVEHRKLSAR